LEPTGWETILRQRLPSRESGDDRLCGPTNGIIGIIGIIVTLLHCLEQNES